VRGVRPRTSPVREIGGYLDEAGIRVTGTVVSVEKESNKRECQE
jgi:hypothetical protein